MIPDDWDDYDIIHVESHHDEKKKFVIKDPRGYRIYLEIGQTHPEFNNMVINIYHDINKKHSFESDPDGIIHVDIWDKD